MSFAQAHDEAPRLARTHGDVFAGLMRALMALAALTLVAVLVMAMRVFVYAYFHGDQQPLQNLFWLLADVLNL